MVGEGVDRDEWRTSDTKRTDNEADLLTKILPSGDMGKSFCQEPCTITFTEVE